MKYTKIISNKNNSIAGYYRTKDIEKIMIGQVIEFHKISDIQGNDMVSNDIVMYIIFKCGETATFKVCDWSIGYSDTCPYSWEE